MPLSGKWTQHMDGGEAGKFRDLLLNDTVVLNRLYAIIEEFEAELDQSDYSIKEYENPSFPYLKADRMGERRALRKLKSLLSFLKED